MKYTKRYLINYNRDSKTTLIKIQTGGYDTQPGTIKCQMEDFFLTDKFNPNIITINYRGINYKVVLTTGHTIGEYPNCKINGVNIFKLENLLTVLNSASGIHVNYDLAGGIKDISLIKDPQFDSTTNIILDRTYTIGRPIRTIEIGHQYVKNGANTNVTWGELLFDLRTEEARNAIESSKIIYSKDSRTVPYYLLPSADGKQTLIFDLGKGGANSCDYILKPSSKYYQSIPQSNGSPADLNKEFYIFIRNLKYYFESIDILPNDTELKKFINAHDMGQKYFSTGSFGFLSLQGDSGAGYYKIDETINSASLIGINISGTTVITLEPSDADVKGIEWDDTIGKLRINNWIVSEVNKCSCIHSIDRIERYLNEDIGGTDRITIV